MLDPATIAASAIAKLAFDEFVKTSVGETAKAAIAGTVDLVKGLRDKIRAKFQGNARALGAIAEVEQGNSAALAKVGKYLDLEMDEAPEFAAEVRQMAQQIISIQNQTTTTRNYENYGRDQINIETIQGNPQIGGS